MDSNTDPFAANVVPKSVCWYANELETLKKKQNRMPMSSNRHIHYIETLWQMPLIIYEMIQYVPVWYSMRFI